MSHEITLTVRTYECDSYGHVNNANYLHYLEYARVEFLNHIGFDYSRMRNMGYGLFVREIHIRYMSPAGPGDTLAIVSRPIKKGAVSGVFKQEIKRGSDTIVDAEVTWAFVNGEGKPVKIPRELNLPQLKPIYE